MVIILYRFQRVEHDPLKYIPLLIEKLSRDKDITAVFLFGSYAEGRQTPVSDFDLAILLERDVPINQHFEKKLELLSMATTALRTDEVDLVILNNAPPALSYQVLTRGRLLFEKEGGKDHRVHFQVQAYDRYFDFQPVERIIHEGLLRRIKEGRFGG